MTNGSGKKPGAWRVRSGIAEACSLLLVPAALALCAVTGIDQAALLALIVVVGALVLFFSGYEKSSLRLRDTMPVAVLAAVAAAGRILFAPIPNFKPVSAIAVIAGAAFGRRAGFMVGALAAFVSNLFFGQGPWTPWQMYAWGFIGYLGGVLASCGVFGDVRKPLPAEDARKGRKVLRLVPLVVWGLLSGFLYGLVLNVWSIIGFYHPEGLAQMLIVYAAAVPFDAVHGVATAFFLVVLYRPWMRKLERVKRKYALR